jgi:hypothetical protein
LTCTGADDVQTATNVRWDALALWLSWVVVCPQRKWTAPYSSYAYLFTVLICKYLILSSLLRCVFMSFVYHHCTILCVYCCSDLGIANTKIYKLKKK